MTRNIAPLYRSLLLASLALSSLGTANLGLAAEGIIVIGRDVHPRVATRPAPIRDPNPLAVNANPSPAIGQALRSFEVSDHDFAGIISGASVQRSIMPDGHLPGLGNVTQQGGAQGLPGLAAGHSGRATGSGIAGQINGSLRQGLAPLKMLSGDR